MSNQDFENIRPFFDSEVGEIVKDLAVSLDWVKIMSPIIGHDNAFEIAESMPHVESIEEFQDELTSPFLEALIEGTTTGVSVSFENNDLEDYFSKPQLHLTNHKDIVLDPSLVNVARMGNGFSSTQVGIGDNLLTQKWVENLVRLNKCFVVPRSGSVRDKLNSSLLVASYIRHVIKNEGSVWLAQREGRAKDGKDATSPALIRMLISEGGKESWDRLRVCPISISYEWDPCDSMKVRELLITERDDEYTKGEGEDEISMALGLTEFKGKVHLHFCETIEWEEEEGKRTERVLAAKVDKAIFNGYKIFPNQILSARTLGIEIPSLVDISSTDEIEFEKRIENVISFVGDDFTRDQVVKKWCEITAQPLLAKLAIEI
tara:strand:- start:73 stop:1197 length:1125 start_codon:yes stop_codon:yes gene_type:complete